MPRVPVAARRAGSATTMRIVVPDLISPSYFPVLAAVELGCLDHLGVDVELGLHFPVTEAMAALRAGEVDVVAGAAHAIFPGPGDDLDLVLLAALSHRTYWFLVVRSDLGVERWADLASAGDLRIAAAPGPDAALRRALEAGPAPAGAVRLVPVPSDPAIGPSFGVQCARALERGEVDGFWANGMGAELAVRQGTGTVVVDARRSAEPPGLGTSTFAALATRRDRAGLAGARATVAGLAEAQAALRRDPGRLASEVAARLFPPLEASLAGALVARDAPSYTAAIEPAEVADLVAFARSTGLTDRDWSYDDVVATGARAAWHVGSAA